MKRIAMLIEYISPITSSLALAITKRGYTVDIFTQSSNAKKPIVNVLYDNVRVINFEYGSINKTTKDRLQPLIESNISQIIQWIEDENISYQLIHAQFSVAGLIAMNLKYLVNIPYVVTYQTFETNPHQTIEEKIYQNADAIIAQLPKDDKELREIYYVDSKKIFNIPYMQKNDSHRKINVDQWEKNVNSIVQVYKIITQSSPQVPVIMIPKSAIEEAFDSSVISQYSSQYELEQAIVGSVRILWQSLKASSESQVTYRASITNRQKDFIIITVKKMGIYYDEIAAKIILFLPQYYHQQTDSLHELISDLEQEVEFTQNISIVNKSSLKVN